MTAASTHDTKRGEDVRARIAALAEVPDLWADALDRLLALAPLPDPGFGNLLWQAVVGVWSDDPALRERLHAYAEKAMREAGDRTTWTEPDDGYEAAVHAAVDAAFDDPRVGAVLDEVLAAVTAAGWSNALAAKLVGLTVPGVPDVYQGSELWEQSLVDPDNRRPVDFAVRGDLLAHERPEHPKFALVREALRLRRDRPELFTSYDAVEASGEAADHVLAFDRGGAVTVATRLPIGLARRGGWGDTTLALPAGGWRDQITGAVVSSDGSVAVADLLTEQPVALLVPIPEQPRTRGRFDVWAPLPQRLRLVGGQRGRRDDPRQRRLVAPVRCRAHGRGRLRLPRRRRRHPGPRPAFATAARWRPRPVPHVRPGGVPLVRHRLARPTAGRRHDLRAARRHLHTRGHPRRRGGEARPPALDRRRLRRADAGQRLQRPARLGLRRRAVVVRPRALRRPGRLPALRGRVPRRRHRRDPGRGPQPPRPLRQLPADVRALPRRRRHPVGRPGQPRPRRVARGPAADPRLGPWLVHRLPRRRTAARRRARAGRRLGDPPAGGDGDRGRRRGGPRRPTAVPDRRVGPQRPPPDHPARGRRARPRRPVERRLPPRGPRGAHRRDRGLLRRLRAARCAREGAAARLLPRRHLVVVPRPRPRRTARRRPRPGLAAGRGQPEPRPGRQPRPR